VLVVDVVVAGVGVGVGADDGPAGVLEMESMAMLVIDADWRCESLTLE
jgi:hypothetical protein